MNVPLKDIADINVGFTFRSGLDYLEPGPVAVIQMKDLEDNHKVGSTLQRIEPGNLKEHHLVRAGDLVFRSRGQFTTTSIVESDPGLAVVAAPLMRVRVKSDVVMPAYLSWYLRQPPAQSALSMTAEGTSLRMISKPALENITVVVPPIEQQRAIVELMELADEEQRLLTKIAEKRKKYLLKLMMQVVQGA